MIHRGKILEQVLRKWSSENGAPLTFIAKKAGYDRSTIYRHFKDESLDYGIIRQYGRIIRHDFSKEFPTLKESDTIGLDPEEPYGGMSKEECYSQVEHWRNKYIKLLEQYNSIVVEKLLMNNPPTR